MTYYLRRYSKAYLVANVRRKRKRERKRKSAKGWPMYMHHMGISRTGIFLMCMRLMGINHIGIFRMCILHTDTFLTCTRHTFTRQI